MDIQEELKYFKEQFNKIGDIVLVVAQHPVFGYLIRPLLFSKATANISNTNWFILSDFEKLNIPKTLLFYKLMDNIFQYSEEVIKKKYCKDKNVKTYDFIRNLDADFVKKHIRPYVELYLQNVIQIVFDNHIPLYLYDNRLKTLPKAPLQMLDGYAEVVYNFFRTENETQYFLTLSYDNKVIPLYQSRGVVLCNKLCWIIINNFLLKLTDDIDGAKILPFFTKSYISVPKQTEEKYYSTFVFNALKKSKVVAKGFTVEEKFLKPLPILQLTVDWQNTYVFVLSFKYDNYIIPAHDTFAWKTEYCKQNDDFYFCKIHRNVEFENEFIAFLKDRNLLCKEGSAYIIKQNEVNIIPYFSPKHEMLNWLNFNHDELVVYQTIVQVNLDVNNQYFIGKIDCFFKAAKRTDWFDITIKLQFGEFYVYFLELRDYIINEIPEFKLPDGSIAVIPAEWFSKLKDVFLFAKHENNSFSLAKHHYALLNQLTGQHSHALKIEVEDAHKLLLQTQVAIPTQLQAKLRPYQVEGFRWLNFLCDNNFGGCLADDMGLGKTLQVIALLCSIKERKKNYVETFETSHPVSGQLNLFDDGSVSERIMPSLVVVPLSLVHNWKAEIQKFASHLTTFVYHGTSRQEKVEAFFNYDVIITTYGTLRNDIEQLAGISFFYIILDESQNIKNPQSKNFLAAVQLRAMHKLVITGTPIENKISDLWSQMAFANPGLLGSYSFFQKEYVSKIEHEKNYQYHIQLKKLIHPFVMRRTKQEVAHDLPELTEIVHYCEMDEAQSILYEQVKSKYRNELVNFYHKGTIKNNTAYILKGLLELRLLANHPHLHPEGKNMASGKFDEIINNLNKAIEEGHKVLFFSQFVKHLQLYQQYCDANNIAYCMLTGLQNEAMRQKMIKEFQENEQIKLFLISLKAGGVGLNLTAASYVFITDPWWNPAAELQAINRAHRIGQHNKVFAYRYITKNTVEEKIILLQQKKQKLADIMVQHSNPFNMFDEKNIMELFE